VDSRIAGFIAYEDGDHVDLLFTAPDFVRRGVASALYEGVEATLTAKGVRELFTEASLVARPFFARHGFEVIEQETVVRRDIELVRFRMRKTLR
jgi:putative acetyltransferase